MSRKCGSCTSCCEGWLTTEVSFQPMYPGKGCQFVIPGKGCSVYDKRPHDPCRTYSCFWILESEVPRKFQPNKSGVIMNFIDLFGYKTINLVPAPNIPSEEMINWTREFAAKKSLCVMWRDSENTPHFSGPKEFLSACRLNMIFL